MGGAGALLLAVAGGRGGGRFAGVRVSVALMALAWDQAGSGGGGEALQLPT